MTQDELLNKIATLATSFTGKSYTVDYSPARNLSERQANKALYRYAKPSSWRRERVTRGTPMVRAEIVLGVIGFESGNITTIQNELDRILYKFLTYDDTEFIVVAGETTPTNSQPLSADDLESDIINGQVTLSVRLLPNRLIPTPMQ